MKVSLAQFMAELLEWKGTPYHDAIFGKHKGANCLRFFCTLQDFCHGFDPVSLPPVPNLPPQTSEHDPRAAWEVVRTVMQRYDASVIYRQGEDLESIDLEPADAILTCNKVGTPAHILIAGPEPDRLWHAYNDAGRKVCSTSLEWCQGFLGGVVRIYRPCGSGVWLC